MTCTLKLAHLASDDSCLTSTYSAWTADKLLPPESKASPSELEAPEFHKKVITDPRTCFKSWWAQNQCIGGKINHSKRNQAQKHFFVIHTKGNKTKIKQRA